jgi:trk system potassium uptake protein TrkH
MVSFAQGPVVLLTLGTLIVLGGLGFPVLGAGWARMKGRRSGVSRLQVRLVLWWSAGLVLVGFLWFGVVEWNGALAHLAPGDRLVSALFQSVTLRTAGFNSIPFDGLGPATVLLMIVMMVIGAAPGGTGGGLKVTTVAVLLGSIPAAAAGRRRVVLGRRSISPQTFFRCAAIAGLGLAVLMGGTLALLLFEGGEPVALLFEAASAVGTVGLTLGATAELDILGRFIVVSMMFLGRVGPLSLAMVLAHRKAGRVEYPETRLMVG